MAEWAKTYSDGIYRKSAIIDECCEISAPDQLQDEFYVGRLKWAFADENGEGAKRFATHDPVPSLKWAPILMDVKRLQTTVDAEDKQPLLGLSEDYSQLDIRQTFFWIWLSRHLDNPELVRMILREGDFLHPVFRRQLFFSLTGGRNNGEKEGSIALHPMMFRLWRLILAGHVRSSESKCAWDMEAHRFLNRLHRENLDYLLLQELRSFLMPAVLLENIEVGDEFSHAERDAADRTTPAIRASLCLRHGSQTGDYFIGEIRKRLESRLIAVFDVLESALMDGLGNLWYLDKNAENSAAITFEIRSIEDHSQNNQRLQAWGGLVDLLRDAWLELADKDKHKACKAFERWIASKHSLFQRLALFAAKRSDVVSPHAWCQCLLDNDGALLWKVHLQREVLRLLATTSAKLSKTDFELLATTIAAGPPSADVQRSAKSDDLDLREHAIWLRLAKMTSGGQKLPEAVQNQLDAISTRHPYWHLQSNQREEFLVWSFGTGDPDFEAEIRHIAVPEQVEALAGWLAKDMEHPDRRFDVKDNWGQLCRGKPQLAFDGLAATAVKHQWNIRRISEALTAWRNTALMQYGHQLVEQHILSSPQDIFCKLARDVAFWCDEAVREKTVASEFVIRVAKRILDISCKHDQHVQGGSPYGDPVTDAINHPVGCITKVLLDCCFNGTERKDAVIPDPYKELFSTVCSTPGVDMRQGRVLLVSRSVGLYYVDKSWVRQFLYPLLDWERDFDEARAAWYGFLWVNRPYPPIMAEIKREFLSTAAHLGDLKGAAKRYCEFLTLLGLWNVPGFRRKEYRDIVASWPVSALEHCADLLRRYQTQWLGSNTAKVDKRISPERIWMNNVEPFIRKIWPKDAQKVSKEICGSFAQLILGTGRKFPDALQALTWALKACPLDGGWKLHMMKDQTTCLQDFPEASLDYLLLVSAGIKWDVDIVEECLSEIIRTKPALKTDARYLQLENWIMRRNG